MKTVWCKHPFSEKNKNENEKEKNLKRKNRDFVSCVMLCNIVTFDLRHFLGFLAGFCVLCGKLSRLH